MEKLSLEDDANESSKLDAAFLDYAKNESVDNLSLYEIEREILCLYDQLIELKLERAILDAQRQLSTGARPRHASYTRLLHLPMTADDSQPDGDVDVRLKNAERECLEARARYILKNSIVEKVLITDPILKAVHSGDNATPAERLLALSFDDLDIDRGIGFCIHCWIAGIFLA